MSVIDFCSSLIRYRSITPAKKDIMEFIANFLQTLGMHVQILSFQNNDESSVYNLYAKIGSDQNSIGFLGHLDVVPAGDDWDYAPFDAVQNDGYLIGRGVSDMKSGIAAFCCAVQKFLKFHDGNIKILLTGDEEVGSYAGTQALINWIAQNDHFPDFCIIGEPSAINMTGDRVYLGHRGSLNVEVISKGKQGHVSCPEFFDNSLAKLCMYIARMKSYNWRYNDKRFPKTNLEPTMLYTKNYAVNVVPEESSANINIRFGADYNTSELESICNAHNTDNLILNFHKSGEAYYCENAELEELISNAIYDVVGIHPQFSAAGGTSDGRFLKDYCNVIEFGVPDATMHQKNEKVKIQDIENLEKIYGHILNRVFK